MQNNDMKPPAEIAAFHTRMQVEEPLTPEEEELKKLQEEENEKASKKGKKNKPGKKATGKKGKKGKGDDDDKPDIIMTGPSEVVQKFDEFYQGYEEWTTKDESKNFNQKYDADMAKKEVLPSIEDEFKQVVDDMINVELDNMRMLRGIKKKKKKKKKGKRGGKGGKKKALPGEKVTNKFDVKDLLVELVQHRIAKKLPAQKLTDFIGEFNYLHSMIDDLKDTPSNPSIALIRQLVTEYAIFPLGSDIVKSRVELTRSILFYGPPGTGKTLVVRAIAHETASMVFDLSPLAIEGSYPERKGEERMVASVMKVAKEF
jgi:SpoVK/Ycf46/Vps4 family AAA+-type ATPase